MPPTSSSSSSGEHLLPTAIGPYEILGVLGRGGMGLVYRARQRGLSRECALKTLHASLVGTRSAQRFVREGQSAAKLGKHPNIVQVFDAGLAGGVPYIAMELVEGEALDKVVALRGPLPERQILEIGRKISAALGHAHGRGIIHRDVKPANIVLDAEGEPQILDFGLAKDAAIEHGLTEEGLVVGTPAYMAPEQADPTRGPLDGRSDLYSLGATLYFAATGTVPFEASSIDQLMAMVVTEDPTPPSDRAPVGSALESVILRCMEKEPEGRYPSGEAMAADCVRVLAGEAPRAGLSGREARVRRILRRHGRTAAAVVAVLAIALPAVLLSLVRKSEVEALVGDLSSEIATSTAREVRALFEPAESLLEECRSLALAELLPVENQELLARHLLARFRFAKKLDWLSYGDEAGRYTGVWRREDGVVLINKSWIDPRGVGHLREERVEVQDARVQFRANDEWDYDPRRRPWYQAAADAPGPVWTGPYPWHDGAGLGMTLSLALRAGGKLRGAFTADFKLDALSRFLGDLKIGKRGRAFLLDRSGRAVAGPRSGAAPAGEAEPLLDAALAALSVRLSAVPLGQVRPFRVVHGDVDHAGAVERFQSGDGLEWATLVVVPVDDFAAAEPERRARIARIAVGATIALLGIAGAVMLYRFARAQQRRRGR